MTESTEDRLTKLEARLSQVERKNERILKATGRVFKHVDNIWTVLKWMYNETVGKVGKHNPDYIKDIMGD